MAGDDNFDDLDLDDETTAKFAAFLEKRDAEQARKRDRNKQPKDFGDFLDRVADAVLDRAEARAAERRKRDDDADEAPDRGRGTSGFQRFWGGGEQRDAG